MDIKQSLSGKIVKSPKGYNAYIPNPLPPKIEWTTQLVNTLSRANYLLGKLAREGNKLPNPYLLIRPFITREAVLSSRIEGTNATIGEILAHDAGISVNQSPDDLQEIQNYIKALDFGLKRLDNLPLSLRLIKEIHEQLMQDVRGSHASPGEFRKTQNWIGLPGCTLNTAKFIPPPVDHLMDCLGELEKFLYDRQLPALIHIALCHYQFEAIHPFLDGNGRVGRLLITLLLIKHKMLPSPLLYLSAFFEATRDEYYKQLFDVSSKNTWQDWLIYFLNGVALQSEDVLDRAEQINNLLNKWKLQVTSGSSNVPITIVNHFAVNPYLTTKKIAKELQLAYSTAERAINKLLGKNIIKQVNNKKRDKVYCATEILSILEKPTKIHNDEE
jgi:Fic family protein